MNFPGENLLSLTQEALHDIIRTHFSKLFVGNVRIINIESSGYYSSGGVKVTFTTDEKTDKERRREERANEPESAPKSTLTPTTDEAPL